MIKKLTACLFVFLITLFTSANAQYLAIVEGDINLNDIPYEIADAVLLSNYFVYGNNVFHNPAQSTLNSDTNGDGQTLGVGDFVYTVRVINGDAQPYSYGLPPQTVSVINHNGRLEVPGDILIGAAQVIIEGNSTPSLLADNMEMMFNFDGENTKIFIYSMSGNSFNGDFLIVNGIVQSIKMGDDKGAEVSAAVTSPPKIRVGQPYPNPFNPTTDIPITLAEVTELKISIFTINGEVVHEDVVSYQAGNANYHWDASEFASGVYLFQITNAHHKPRKLLLIK